MPPTRHCLHQVPALTELLVIERTVVQLFIILADFVRLEWEMAHTLDHDLSVVSLGVVGLGRFIIRLHAKRPDVTIHQRL